MEASRIPCDVHFAYSAHWEPGSTGSAAVRDLIVNKPQVFITRALGPWVLHVDSVLEGSVLDLGIQSRQSLESLCDEAQTRAFGRGTNAILALPGRRERLHLRPLRHGGLLARVTGTRYLGMSRPLAELRATAELRAAGVPVPLPVLALGRREGRFWEVAFGSVHEEDTLDGLSFLDAGPSWRRIERAMRAAGRSIRMLHDAGGRHRDLQIRNLLIREDADRAEVVIVDLDAARITGNIRPSQRMRELMRLYRSLHKRRLTSALEPRALASFFSAYLDGDRELRSAMRAWLPVERTRIAAHSLFYRLAR